MDENVIVLSYECEFVQHTNSYHYITNIIYYICVSALIKKLIQFKFYK